MASVVFDADPSIFAASAVPLLEANEAANGLMLGIAGWMARSARPDDALLFRVLDSSGRTTTAGLQVPPNNLVLGAANADEVRLIVEALAAREIVLPGVNGPAETLDLFEACWLETTGQAPQHKIEEILYRLDAVIPRERAPGTMRRAGETDLDLVRKWVQAFVAEVLPNDAVTPDQLAAVAARRVGEGELYLWERDGVPVGIAGCAGSTRNGIRITNVYTPKALRGQGIASALVASLSALMLAQGRVFCFLYIDAANPVSAHVYESVGYRPVCYMRHTDYA